LANGSICNHYSSASSSIEIFKSPGFLAVGLSGVSGVRFNEMLKSSLAFRAEDTSTDASEARALLNGDPMLSRSSAGESLAVDVDSVVTCGDRVVTAGEGDLLSERELDANDAERGS